MKALMKPFRWMMDKFCNLFIFVSVINSHVKLEYATIDSKNQLVYEVSEKLKYLRLIELQQTNFNNRFNNYHSDPRVYCPYAVKLIEEGYIKPIYTVPEEEITNAETVDTVFIITEKGRLFIDESYLLLKKLKQIDYTKTNAVEFEVICV